MNKHEKLTQKFSTWGDKLLQHTDVLSSIQNKGEFKPITIQLAPVEICDSDCPFCSVAGRPLKQYLPLIKIKKVLDDFKSLGAKSLEITGGGNPLLYRDKETKENINDIIRYASSIGYDIGIITNSHSLKRIDPEVYSMINWIRVSLIKLDEGKSPEDYNFNGFPYDKLAFSYIIYDGQKNKDGEYVVDELSRTNKVYTGTSVQSIEDIGRLVTLYPKIKFVRIAGNCLIKGNNAETRDKWKDIVDKIDELQKIFIKDIGHDDSPFNDGCYVGMIRPYVAPSPHDDGVYNVYICTSHVLNARTYDLDYALCNIDDILSTWRALNNNYQEKGYPYEVKCNEGLDWESSCKYCYYKFNNKILHTVAQEMPDKNFP